MEREPDPHRALVAVGMTTITGWRTSSRCGATECVEVGTGQSVIGVRDSKLEQSPVLVFGAETWSAFTAAVRTGTVGH